METTSATLLGRVRDVRDGDAWREFFALYFPLIRKYARARGLHADDAEEVAQECMKLLAQHMRRFRYSPNRGRFRGYLRTLVQHQIASLWRRKRPRQARAGDFEAWAAAPAPDAPWERLWLREHLVYCVARLELRCADHTVQAFRLYVLQDWPVERVCETLGLSANQVYLAKTRMIRRLREEVTQLVGDVL
jgi:RNA polymerase sigma-70 factor (ECF subfamily)